MNRRGFFETLTKVGAGFVLAPSVNLFLPKIEPVRWKVCRGLDLDGLLVTIYEIKRKREQSDHIDFIVSEDFRDEFKKMCVAIYRPNENIRL